MITVIRVVFFGVVWGLLYLYGEPPDLIDTPPGLGYEVIYYGPPEGVPSDGVCHNWTEHQNWDPDCHD